MLDHLDDLQNGETFQLRDEGLVELLVSAGMTPHPPRWTTTSRQPLNLPPELLANVEVRELADGLSEADGVALLRSFPDHSGRIRRESDERLAQVVRTVHGIPHGLELVVSIASTDQFFIDTLLESSEAPDELIEKLVSQNYEALDDAGAMSSGCWPWPGCRFPSRRCPRCLSTWWIQPWRATRSDTSSTRVRSATNPNPDWSGCTHSMPTSCGGR